MLRTELSCIWSRCKTHKLNISLRRRNWKNSCNFSSLTGSNTGSTSCHSAVRTPRRGGLHCWTTSAAPLQSCLSLSIKMRNYSPLSNQTARWLSLSWWPSPAAGRRLQAFEGESKMAAGLLQVALFYPGFEGVWLRSMIDWTELLSRVLCSKGKCLVLKYSTNVWQKGL